MLSCYVTFAIAMLQSNLDM